MPRRRELVFAVATALACGACVRHPPSGGEPHRPWVWAEPREAYIRRSQVWLGADLASWTRHMRTLDLAAGPGGVTPESLVDCTYLEPGKNEFSGATPKFTCRPAHDGRDDKVKVKYGAENGEIYAEVAGSRLFWALGFATDRVDPVRVRCSGCADDPWHDRTLHPDHVVMFDPAAMEHELPGRTIQEYKHQGWTWAEFDAIDPAAGGAPRAHTDALRLLAAFVQHRDSKADNQRLLCPPDAVASSPSGQTCRRPIMMILDDGSFFGGSRWGGSTRKMALDAWESAPVWKDAGHCIAGVTSEWDATDGLDHPRIGEEGRRFLATLLSGLDRAQVTALFSAARADRRGDVQRWVATFEERREQIVHPLPERPDFRCPDVVAEDSAPSGR